jgi:hypothetical protein
MDISVAATHSCAPSCASASMEDVDSRTEAAVNTPELSTRDRICRLNDTFRRAFHGSEILLTQQFLTLPPSMRRRAIDAIKACDSFPPEYDIYQEHDLVMVDVDGTVIYAKIDYYALDMGFPAEDPSDPLATKRVMTIMLSNEF